jgi:hypothetical protein
MQDQASTEIWRDEETWLPMHSHPVAIPAKDGTVDYWRPMYSPCNCGVSAYDHPVQPSAQHQPPKGDH